MSIITFWNDSREQTGQTYAAIALATRMSIERNSKILLISTSANDSTMRKCYWGNENVVATKLFDAKTSTVAVENGIEGLYKLYASNKLAPSTITDYTRVIFKGRLEVIAGYTTTGRESEEEAMETLRKIDESYLELIRTANQYYDMVIVDLDKRLSKKIRESIIRLSEVNVLVLSQKMESLIKYGELKRNGEDWMKNRCIPVIGKYIKEYKYNSKNISRFLQEKKELDLVPFNIQYMSAAEEMGVVDLFLKPKNTKDKTDENYIFMECVQNLTNNILKKLQEMQMRMR